MIQVYYSTNTVPFSTMFIEENIEIRYPFIADPPSPDILDPQYDWKECKWVDRHVEQVLAELSEIKNEFGSLSETAQNAQSQATDAIKQINEQLVVIEGLNKVIADQTEEIAIQGSNLEAASEVLNRASSAIETIRTSINGHAEELEKNDVVNTIQDDELASVMIALAEVYEMVSL